MTESHATSVRVVVAATNTVLLLGVLAMLIILLASL